MYIITPSIYANQHVLPELPTETPDHEATEAMSTAEHQQAIDQIPPKTELLFFAAAARDLVDYELNTIAAAKQLTRQGVVMNMPTIVGKHYYKPEVASSIILQSKELPEYVGTMASGAAVLRENQDAQFALMLMMKEVDQIDNRIMPAVMQLDPKDRLDSILRMRRRMLWQQEGEDLYDAIWGENGYIRPGTSMTLMLQHPDKLYELLDEKWGARLSMYNFAKKYHFVFFINEFERMMRDESVAQGTSELANAYPEHIGMTADDIKLRMFRLALINHALPPEKLKLALKTAGGLTPDTERRRRNDYLHRLNLPRIPYTLYTPAFIPKGLPGAFSIPENYGILVKARQFVNEMPDLDQDTRTSINLRSF